MSEPNKNAEEQELNDLEAFLEADDELFDPEVVDTADVVADVVAEDEGDETTASSIYEDDDAGTPEPDAGEVETDADASKVKRINTANMSPSEIIRTKVPNYVDILIVSRAVSELSDADRKISIDNLLTAVDGKAKKVGEKVVNIANHIANGVNLSVYTRIAVELLKDARVMSLAELRADYQAANPKPYSSGTASAQGSQMMSVLPFLGIASKEGSTLTWVEDNPIGTFILGSETPAEASEDE